MVKPITIRHFEPTDFPFAQQIRAAAGWNQTTADWKRLLEHQPDGCFLACWHGRRAATATTICYGSAIGWIGMVLVDPPMRRRGIATALLRHCIDYLSTRVQCIKLDATPAGKTVYDRLGFQVEYQLTRWQREPWRVTTRRPLRSIDESWWAEINRLDAPTFGTDRCRWLQRLARDSAATGCDRSTDGNVSAFGMVRAGAKASYLGPVVAGARCDASELTCALLDHCSQNTVFWDIPDDNATAVQLAQQLTFKRQRTLLRMWAGHELVPSIARQQWAIAGPAVG